MLALQLAGQFMENEGSGIDVIERFSGRTAEMADYLSEQILLGLPDEIQSFLMETSVLERFNGDIANAIRGKTDSWFMVEELERRNLFLFFLDSERKWFRYHHLFQEFLHERLRRLDTARLESLNRAAADWFVRNGQLSTAVHHAILANDLELAADLLEQAGGWRMVLTGQVGIIRSACDKIPKKNIRERPRLWLGEILLLAKTGTIVEARRKLDEFTASGFAAVQSDKPLYAEHQVVDIIVAGYEDRRVSAKDLSSLEESVADPEVLDNVVLALLYNYLCLVYLDFCRFDKSIEAGNRSINHFRAMGNDYAEKLVETHIGQAKLGQGRLINARDIYQRVYDSAQASFGFDDDAAAIAGTLLAETAYERNELAAAKELLDTTLPHVERFDGWFDIYAAGYLTASSVAHATDGIDAALTVLDRAEETARRRGLDRLVLLSRVHRARELTLAGRLDEAAAIVARNEAMRSRGSGFSSWRLWEAMGPMLARLALRRGDPGGALEILRPLEEEAAANGCEHQSIRLLALLALTNHEKGERKIALECLERAVLLAAPQGFVRPFVEEGEAMKQLFSNLLKAGPKLIPAVTSFVEAILNTEEAYGGALLSERESQILGMISSGHSTKEMAHLLALSENTVKYHRKRVYKKLGVASRSQAVATARRLLLLS